jgi:lipopolysaccharide transport system ATP-binding protein
MSSVIQRDDSPIMELRNVGTYYWRRQGYLRQERYWAVRDVSFRLYRGETLGVIGRNGAGKSTLLKLLAGIVRPNRGELINHGCQATLLSLQVGFLPGLSGRQNAILSGMLLGLHKRQVEQQLEAIKDFSELGEFFEQPVQTYSSGMGARLGFSVAFLLDPDVLLIDEVLGVGDANFRAKSTAAMQEKIRSNKTIVLVSHSDPTIRQLCDRAVWIEDGVSLAEGATDEVLRDYQRFMKDKR